MSTKGGQYIKRPTNAEVITRMKEAADRCTIDIIAVDPGDAHVGIARWTKQSGMRSTEMDADKAVAAVHQLLSKGAGNTALITERFVLYPNKASAQSWSPMATSEMIGALKWIAHQQGVPVVMQGADIKKPTRAQCRVRHLNVKTASTHAADAQLHAWYWLLRNEIIEGKENEKEK